MLYVIVKFVHVLLAIVAVGANATYGVWLARLNTNPESAESILRGIKILDDRLANPAYGLLLVTGLLEAYLGGYSLGTKWIDIALVLYVVLVIIAVVLYTPTLKKQIAVVAAEGANSAHAEKLAARGRIVGIILGVIAVAIVFLMVAKPT
jgi:uncharacterized membrane protein